jgi:hypothetical protein
VVTGIVNGPGPRGAGVVGGLLPPLPPPPLLPPLGLLPPVPPALPPAPLAPGPPFVEVPVIPEAESLLLVSGGLALAGALVALRRRAERRR